MEFNTDSMPAKFPDYAVSLAFRKALNGVADIAQLFTDLDFLNTAPHGLISDFAKPPGLNSRFANVVHATRIAMIAVLDDGHVNIEDVAGFKPLFARYAMAHLVVDGRANRSRIRRVSRRGVI